ncbi:hypothetical protein F4819DRAFT_447800 [Hypoxylon fuscum]|nr:hypothetical protein F4819DRAFT_447800 [Hypoxylon fuscum]
MLLRYRSSRRALDNMTQNQLVTTIWAKLKNLSLRVKEWCTSSYRTCDVGEHEPLWVSARRSNCTHCAFYRLPEELVLQILGNLDNATKGIAQRTCGLFMRIMFDPTLDCRRPAWWFKNSFPSYNVDVLPLLVLPDRDILDRDRFCDDCLRFREDGRYDNAMKALQNTLWCSHCNESHKRPAFSSRQRAASPAIRVCVLAEGKAHICNHESISWVKDLKPITSTKKPHQLCRHPDHYLSWYTCWKHFWDDLRGSELILHGKPHINLFFNEDRPLRISSQATIFLFKLHHQTPVTRAFLQEQLIANAHTLGKMLCPHVTVDDGQLLLPFCSNRCACFDSMPWVNHDCTGVKRLCCRCTAAELRGRTGYFLPTYLFHQHSYKCNVCDASYSWGRYGSAVTITIRALMGSCEPALPKDHCLYRRRRSWAYKLHPESWGILEDDELRHVAWCDDIFCASRWRWEKLSRLLVQ